MKKRFLLRLDADVYDALERWAADELRSVNGQIEFLVGDALKKVGRSPKRRVRDEEPIEDETSKR